MADRLNQVLTFTAVPALGQASLPYRLGVQGVAVLADFIFVDTPNFTIIGQPNTATVTVQNNGLVAATVNVWMMRLHTFDRAFGDNAIQNLTPQPYIIYGGSSSGGGGSSIQAFRYIATGAEGSDFNITLPAARASDLYRVFATPASVAEITPLSFPDTLAGDRTTTQFRCVTGANLTINDQIDLLVITAT